MNLDEIRAKLEAHSNRTCATVEEIEPITYEQYKMWEQLKNPVPKHKLIQYDDYSNSIKCPHCGNTYMHHLGIETFHCEEDQNGYHVELYDETSHGWGMMNIICPENTTNENTKSNPSARRGGILILFGCENCHNISRLGIAQHKGQSLVSWSFKP